MKVTNVKALKMNTAKILQAVEEGEELIITYHGKPKAMLIKIREEEFDMKESKRSKGILSKNHPFFKLIGKGMDDANDVSANKYKYLGLATERKG